VCSIVSLINQSLRGHKRSATFASNLRKVILSDRFTERIGGVRERTPILKSNGFQKRGLQGSVKVLGSHSLVFLGHRNKWAYRLKLRRDALLTCQEHGRRPATGAIIECETEVVIPLLLFDGFSQSC
jgi:hypothetical protein